MQGIKTGSICLGLLSEERLDGWVALRARRILELFNHRLLRLNMVNTGLNLICGSDMLNLIVQHKSGYHTATTT